MAMLGNPISTQAFPVDYFTGDGTSTTFQLSRIPASPNSILVYVNGVKRVSSFVNPGFYVDAANLIFPVAPTASATIEVVHLGILSQVNVPSDQSVTLNMLSFPLSNTFVFQTTANGATASFTLNAPPVSANSLVVSANGIVQHDYSTNSNTLTFGYTPPAGTLIRVTSLALAQANVPADGSVTSVKLGSNLTLNGNTSINGSGIFFPGSAALPSITTSGDTNTGMFFPAADTIAFAEGGVEAMRIDSSGRVGIGTNSPASNLTVKGSVNIIRAEYVTDTSQFTTLNYDGVSVKGPQDAYWNVDSGRFHTWYTGALERMRITSTGAVGIGTSSPSSFLDVDAGSNQEYFRGSGSSGSARALVFAATTTTNPGDTHNLNAISVSGVLSFSTFSTERMRITNTGNILVGTTSTTNFVDRMRVIGNTNGVDLGGSSSTGVVRLRGSDTGAGIVDFTRLSQNPDSSPFYNGRIFYDLASNFMWFGTNSTERMRIDSTGNVLVGTTINTNSSRLTANGTISETVNTTQYLVASQFDVGTEPNKIPLNQYLGSMAYQNSESVGMTDLSVSGVSTFAAGSNTAPAITTTGDTNTGIFFPAADTIAFTEGGVESMRIDSAGNVGIGTSAPTTRLHARSGGAQTISTNLTFDKFLFEHNDTFNFVLGAPNNKSTRIAFNDTDGRDRGGVDYSHSLDALSFLANGNERMRINSAGAVGIGTTSPTAARLQVTGTGTTTLSYVQNTDSFAGGTNFTQPHFAVISGNDTTGNVTRLGLGVGSGAQVFLDAVMESGVTVYSSLLFRTRGADSMAERMRLNSSGNLGLGVTPSAWAGTIKALQIGSTVSLYNLTSSTFLGHNTFYNGTNDIYLTTSGASLYQQSVGQHRWYNAPSGTAGNAITFTQAMTLDASGRLGIGTTSPSEKLEVRATNGFVTVRTEESATPARIRFGYGGDYSQISASNFGGDLFISADESNTKAGSFMSFRVDATERMRITSAGDVGIGLTAPNAKLEILGGIILNKGDFSGGGTGALRIRGTTTAAKIVELGLNETNNYGVLNVVQSGVGGLPLAINTNGGNVGIGTTSPSALLTVQKSQNVDTQLQVVNADGGTAAVARLDLVDNASSFLTFSAFSQGYSGTFFGVTNAKLKVIFDNSAPGFSNGLMIGTAQSVPLYFATAATERMRIDSNGNVGIGTSSPSFRLHAVTDINAFGANVTNGGFSLREFGGSAANNTLEFNIRPSAGKSGYIIFTENAVADRWSVGIQNGVDALRFLNGVPTSGTERMRLTSGGSLLIGRTSQINQEDFGVTTTDDVACSTNRASSTSYYPWVFYSNSNVVGFILSTSTTTEYATSSDYRLKENVAPMTGALATVAQLKPVTYTWKVDGSSGQGFIAHELQKVVPDAVTGEKDDVNEDGSIKPQGIDTSFLVATLTAAIQEQQALITSLTARIAALESN